jgi:MFS superfamily sulfate permease-like transporter
VIPDKCDCLFVSTGPPVLLSPESAAGIKAGAKTGLSTLVCGVLFGISTFFAPFFASIPSAGTAPLLIMVGVMMFGNAKRIDWADYKIAVPAYCVLFFIPFTYSILRGVAIGYIVYIMINLYTGDLFASMEEFIKEYRQPWFAPKPKPLAVQELEHDEDSQDEANKALEDEISAEQSKTVVGRVILGFQRLLDAQEMSADTGVNDVAQF